MKLFGLLSILISVAVMGYLLKKQMGDSQRLHATVNPILSEVKRVEGQVADKLSSEKLSPTDLESLRDKVRKQVGEY